MVLGKPYTALVVNRVDHDGQVSYRYELIEYIWMAAGVHSRQKSLTQYSQDSKQIYKLVVNDGKQCFPLAAAVVFNNQPIATLEDLKNKAKELLKVDEESENEFE